MAYRTHAQCKKMQCYFEKCAAFQRGLKLKVAEFRAFLRFARNQLGGIMRVKLQGMTLFSDNYCMLGH